MILGEITTKAKVNLEKVVRDAIKEVGYDDERKGMDYKKASVVILIDE
jgi:S-adenosylmethionine synthetase